VTHIIHVTEDMALMSGGVPAVVRQLATHFSLDDYQVSLLHAKGDSSEICHRVTVRKCQPHGPLRRWSYSSNLQPSLNRLFTASTPDGSILHIHGLWTAPPTLASYTAKQLRIPSVFTSHGMLAPWLWNNQGSVQWLKKTLFWQLLGKKCVANCSILHAVTPLERDELASLVSGCQIEVIPNAIEIRNDRSPYSNIQKNFLFLGRLEPKKGIDILIKAFASARLPCEFHLLIAGPSWSDRYLSLLYRLVSSFGLTDRIRFIGPVFGLAKQNLLDSSWLLVCPSHAEVVGLVNLEAAAHYLPSITTHQTGLWDWEAGGGYLVQPDITSLTQALESAASWSDSERAHRGIASHSLVEQRYSWKVVLPLWKELYSLLND
jgi:glycosyltransferase involved in cell wall biosynthesis